MYDLNMPCDDLFKYAQKVGGYKDCWAKAEEALTGLTLKEGLEHPRAAEWGYRYARYVIKGRFLEAEAVIAEDAGLAYCYARYVIKGRFLEAEDVIAKSAGLAYCYALDVIKGRFLEAEAVIAKNAMWGYYYARYVIKDLDWIKEMNKNVRP